MVTTPYLVSQPTQVKQLSLGTGVCDYHKQLSWTGLMPT